MTVVEAYSGRRKIDPLDDSSQFVNEVSSLLHEGIAQNTAGSVFTAKVSLSIAASLTFCFYFIFPFVCLGWMKVFFFFFKTTEHCFPSFLNGWPICISTSQTLLPITCIDSMGNRSCYALVNDQPP